MTKSDRPRRAAILHNPSVGMRLRRYISRCETIDGESPHWLDPDPAIRASSARQLIITTKNWSELPRPIVQEFILLPWLVAAGMPEGLVGKWLDRLLDDATDRIIDRFRADEKERDKLPSKRKGGHPPAPLLASTIVYAAFLDTLIDRPQGLSTNRRCEIVARRLSGDSRDTRIGRATISKVVTRYGAFIATLSPADQKRFGYHHGVIQNIMEECDRLHPPDRHVFYNPRSGAGYSGTQAPLTFRSPLTRG